MQALYQWQEGQHGTAEIIEQFIKVRTGETGEGVPNELPNVLNAYRRFEAWFIAGADEKPVPEFSE